MSRDRDRRREYDGDVFYEVWRSGRDPDRIDYDRVADNYHSGYTSDEAASEEIRHMRQTEQRRHEADYEEMLEQQQREEQYYNEQREAEYYAELERERAYRYENYDEHGYYR